MYAHRSVGSALGESSANDVVLRRRVEAAAASEEAQKPLKSRNPEPTKSKYKQDYPSDGGE